MAIRSFGGGGGGGSGAYPGMLDATYSPEGLWLFDGDGVNSGSAGTGTSTAFAVQRGAVQYLNTVSATQQSMLLTTADGLDSAAAAHADFRVVGDCTVQLVYTPIVQDIGDFGTLLFLQGDGATAAHNEMWCLRLHNTGSALIPVFRWETAPGVYVSVQDVGEELILGKPNHIVGRRWDVGEGAYTGELWLNGTLLATLTSQDASADGDDGLLRIGANSGNDLGVDQGIFHSAKFVGRKLTDSELENEFALTGLDLS